MDISYILHEKFGRHGASYTIINDDYDTLEWNSTDVEKPTLDQISQWANEIEAKYNLQKLREKRNKLLTETDYLAFVDNTLTDEMRDYRQALRDITDYYSSLDDVVWPAKPE